MPRVRWCGLPVLCLLGLCFRTSTVLADCWYGEESHEEGSEVPTAEPCLNCTCSRGALLCYLRVCPKLPNPPPPGCILLHRYRTCCPELICTEIFGGGNDLEARAESDGLDVYDRAALENACVANGSIYGPGSAMDSSSLCEYCYCLGGKQICVKPKCLLPIEGCVPMYEPTNCCPVHYNCSYPTSTTSSTTTEKPKEKTREGGCIVDGTYYSEGGKVLGVGHSVCDNCYCLRGMLRCEPLSCAPPLFGCVPVVRVGECCAASYNCSGTIEIRPEPNYGEFPIMSKEYAKFRKETSRKNSVTENSNAPFYVIADSLTTTKIQRSPSGTTRHFTGISFDSSTKKPYYQNSMMEDSSSKKYYATTNVNYKKTYSTTSKPKSTELNTFRTVNTITTTDYKENEKLRSSDYLDLSDETLLSIVDSLLDSRLNRRVEGDSGSSSTVTENIPTTDLVTSTEIAITETTVYETSTTEQPTTDTNEPSNISLYPVTMKTILNSTDCTNGSDIIQEKSDWDVTTVLPIDANEVNKLAEASVTTSEEFSVETTSEHITESNLESRVKHINSTTAINRFKKPIEIEAILNITKSKDQDYEYDYNEPSLPPSLPNLRIIPFVAADALDSDKDHNVIHAQERVTDTSFGYTSLFSPPTETEGGFIPKQPPILENFYENAVTPLSITNTPKLTETGCTADAGDIPHGQTVPSESPCITCTCFYGNIVCQKTTCPIPAPGCRKTSVQDTSMCCPRYICDGVEAPTVVLDRLEGTSKSQEVVTVAEGVITPDPFKDVIKTEPAPDLQSLIVDMMPFLVRKTTPISATTEKLATPKANNNTTHKQSEGGNLFLDNVLQLLFSNKNTDITTEQIQTFDKQQTADSSTTTVAPSTTAKVKSVSSTALPTAVNSNEKDSSLAILKLAGCNIYGRMYRVGRIISELSNPCLECKCTEIGVQCRALKC